ncbi:RNA polymerase Rpc34 [Patellaria atrata CBS 101060]|uniref:DNA-directed RNA polymerase III subunit RPC6 n=1 Tax=Patellaria atrata CBS 101060 TaxID=1346257 RepID=A0A9P4SFZ7_9PEZI|nr:RNA polymerase Rpc34 [Patellaria atrata CBS 101060]
MASSSAGKGAKKYQLYDKCERAPPKTIFFQTDLTNYGVASDLTDLLNICQALVAEQLFQQLESDGSACWRLRSREDAAKIRALTNDERIIYGHIESAGQTPIWLKTIKRQTNMHQNTVDKAVRSLETKMLIKSITSRSRRMYMLAHLEPCTDISGSGWHSEGELDISLIEHACMLTIQYVRDKSWAEQKLPASILKSSIDAKKRAVSAAKQNPKAKANSPKYKPRLGPHNRPLIPFPAGWQQYPTADDIRDHLNIEGVFSFEVTEDDLKTLLDMLVFDGKLERMGARGFRSVRELENEDDEMSSAFGNGLTQAPCGRCPVFTLCEEGGPVNASNCVYFDEWLKF